MSAAPRVRQRDRCTEAPSRPQAHPRASASIRLLLRASASIRLHLHKALLAEPHAITPAPAEAGMAGPRLPPPQTWCRLTVHEVLPSRTQRGERPPAALRAGARKASRSPAANHARLAPAEDSIRLQVHGPLPHSVQRKSAAGWFLALLEVLARSIEDAQAMGRGPWAVGRGPWAVGHGPGPWAVGHGPWAMGHVTRRAPIPVSWPALGSSAQGQAPAGHPRLSSIPRSSGNRHSAPRIRNGGASRCPAPCVSLGASARKGREKVRKARRRPPRPARIVPIPDGTQRPPLRR